jgi:hypothetical protein
MCEYKRGGNIQNENQSKSMAASHHNQNQVLDTGHHFERKYGTSFGRGLPVHGTFQQLPGENIRKLRAIFLH